MNSSKAFIADSSKEKSLVLAYLRFPEISEVFLNIAKGRSATENVLSEWDSETLECHTREFILPQLIDAGVIRKDATRPCGFATDYSDLSFVGLSRMQLATVASKRALLISETIEANDSKSEVISANLHFQSLPDHLRSELVESLRNILNKYISDIPGTNTEGRAFRLALVARASS